MTRGDFYMGRGLKAEWIGSIAFDAFPESPRVRGVLKSTTAREFRRQVKLLGKGKTDFSSRADGWPWPWTNSCTTDFAYAYVRGEVFVSFFGGNWIPAHTAMRKSFKWPDDIIRGAEFPQMITDHSAPIGSARNGMIVVSSK